MSSSRRPQFVPQLETLEDRMVPAGVITTTFSNHLLTITGDSGSQNIALLGAGVGHVSISQQDGETFAGHNSFNKVRQIVVNLGDGDDTVTVVDLKINHPGSYLKFKGGNGNNSLFFDGKKMDIFNLLVVNGTGTFTMDDLHPVQQHFSGIDIECPLSSTCNIVLGGMGVDGPTKVVTGDAPDTIQIDNADFRGSVTLNTAGGDDMVTMGQLAPNDKKDVTFEGALTIKCGAGNDTVSAGVTVHAPGQDDLTVDIVHFMGTVLMDGGNDVGGGNPDTSTDTIEVHHPRSTDFQLEDNPELDNWEVIAYNP